MACCGYVALLMAEFLIVCLATAGGGIIGYFAGSRIAGALSAAGLAVALNAGGAAAMYYYTQQALAQPGAPQYLQEIAGLGLVGAVVGGVVSFLLCRAMR